MGESNAQAGLRTNGLVKGQFLIWDKNRKWFPDKEESTQEGKTTWYKIYEFPKRELCFENSY